MSPAFERLLRAGEALLERIRKSEGSPNKWLGAFAADVEALLEKWK